MYQATFADKKIQGDEYDEYSELLEIAELAVSAHSPQHNSPLGLAQFLLKLNHGHFADKKEPGELEAATDIFLETIDW